MTKERKQIDRKTGILKAIVAGVVTGLVLAYNFKLFNGLIGGAITSIIFLLFPLFLNSLQIRFIAPHSKKSGPSQRKFIFLIWCVILFMGVSLILWIFWFISLSSESLLKRILILPFFQLVFLYFILAFTFPLSETRGLQQLQEVNQKVLKWVLTMSIVIPLLEMMMMIYFSSFNQTSLLMGFTTLYFCYKVFQSFSRVGSGYDPPNGRRTYSGHFNETNRREKI